MHSPGFWEIVILAIFALFIFGPERLPKVARQVGTMIGQFRREASGTLDELRRAAELEDMDELRNIAEEVRGSTRDLRRSMTLTGPLAADTEADPAKPARPARPTVKAEGPPPFDPDAT
jgi:sec-independent protein translocase protein TatB